jgi:uncharacterized membrane protein YvbJ
VDKSNKRSHFIPSKPTDTAEDRIEEDLEERAGILDRVEEKQTVTNDIINTPANGDTASNDSTVGMLYNDHPASQNPATNDPNMKVDQSYIDLKTGNNRSN